MIIPTYSQYMEKQNMFQTTNQFFYGPLSIYIHLP